MATKKEKEWMRKIVEFGCIACYVMGHEGTPAVVHHLTERGRRKGHLYTIPLCPDHHKTGSQYQAGDKIPYHHNEEAFEAEYGTVEDLLKKVKNLVE